MAEKEIYDYISTATPDNDVTMTLAARGAVTERTTKNQIIHLGVDGSEERITISSTVIAYLEYPFSALSNSDAGTVFDFWHDAAKGNGKVESFKLDYTDGHTYVVRFESDMDRVRTLGNFQSMSVVFKILGRIDD
jgi:hypothetical protein